MKKLLVLFSVLVLVPEVYSQTSTTLVGLYGTIGYSQYAMEDVNDELTALGMDNIDNGIGFTGGLRFVMNKTTINVSVFTLSANSEYSDPTGSVEYNLPVLGFEVAPAVNVSQLSNMSLYLGAGLGYYKGTGEIKLELQGFGSMTGEIEANTFGVRLFAEAELMASKNLSILLSAGYRLADMADIKVADQSVDNYSIDYSGVCVTGGIIVYFGK